MMAPMRHLLWLLTFAAIPLTGCGCIGLPLTEHPETKSHQDVRSLVGDAKSGRPVRIGVTNRPEVLDQLGEPVLEAAGGRAIGYEYKVNATKWYGPLIVNSKAIFPLIRRYTPAYYYLFLEFDESNVLRRFDLRRRWGYEYPPDESPDSRQKLWAAFLAAVPASKTYSATGLPRD